MKSPAFRLLLVLAAAFVAFHLGDDAGRVAARMRLGRDELAWIRDEFGVQGERLERVRELHRAYRERREAGGAELEKERTVLAGGLDAVGELTPELRRELAEVERLRARGHAEALEYCLSVSRELGGEPGRRYLREMERVLLGLEPRHHSQAITPGPASGLAGE